MLWDLTWLIGLANFPCRQLELWRLHRLGIGQATGHQPLAQPQSPAQPISHFTIGIISGSMLRSYFNPPLEKFRCAQTFMQFAKGLIIPKHKALSCTLSTSLAIMEEELARLQQQLQKQQRQREEAERRVLEKQRRREEAESHVLEEQRRREEEQHRHEEAEEAARASQSQTLEPYLESCHSFGLAIEVVTDHSLTIQGNTTNPVGRIYPRRIVPWHDFPARQEEIWHLLSTPSFASQHTFPSQH